MSGCGNSSGEIPRLPKTETLRIYTASWCGPCQRLKECLKDPEVAPLVAKYKIEFIDVDKDKQYTGKIPFYFIYDYDNHGGLRQQKIGTGFVDKKEFIKWLKL